METRTKNFRPIYISHVIDFLTAFQDSRRIIEKTSQSDTDNLLRSLHLLRDTSDHFESFTSTVHGRPEHPEGPEDPLGEPWYPIKEEETEITEIRL